MKDIFQHITGGVRCAFFAAPSDHKITPHHIRENSELIELITAGKVYWEDENGEHEYGRGTIFWHQYGEHTVYRTPMSDPYRCAVWEFEVKDFPRQVPRIGFWTSPLDMDVFVADCIKTFHGGTLEREVIALYSYGVLFRQMAGQGARGTNMELPNVLTKAIKIIEKNLSSALTVDFIAGRTGVSKPYLFALFKKHMDCSPHQYVLAQQLLKARNMLATQGMPIKEIAAQCGFDTLEVFYRQFRRICGMTPGEYRRRNSFYR